MKVLKPLTLFLIIAQLFAFLPATFAQQYTAIPAAISSLTYPITQRNLTVDIGLVGFSNITIDASLMRRLLPFTIAPYLQSNSVPYGVTYNPTYSVVFYGQNINQSLRRFLQSNATVRHVPPYLQQIRGENDGSNYDIISVRALNDWLNEMQGPLGVSNNHYLILVANATGAMNLDHYYELSSSERDNSTIGSRYASLAWSSYYSPVVSWLISWGGESRIYFIDLSAGSQSSSFDYSFRSTPHIPLQYYAASQPARSGSEITEYVANYVSEAIRELIFQNYSKFPLFTAFYTVKIFVIDQTGRMSLSNYQQFLNSTLVEEIIQNLVPYAHFKVETQLIQLDTDPALRFRINSDLIAQTQTTTFDSTGIVVSQYDAQGVYEYLRAMLGSYVGTVSNGTLPIFAFAFKSAGRLAQTYAGSIVPSDLKTADGEPRTATVFSFPELALVSMSERQLFDWGLGFSHAVIQAAGQLLGLQRPSWNGGFSMIDAQASSSSRQTYAFVYSRFDEDAIQRAHADYLMSLDEEQLDQNFGLTLPVFKDQIGVALVGNATQTLGLGSQAYDNLDFVTAVQMLNTTYSLIDKLFYIQAKFVEATLDTLGDPTTLDSTTAISTSRAQLARALDLRVSGDLVGSVHYLGQASVSAAIGQSIETYVRASRLRNIILGFLVGIVVALCLVLGFRRPLLRRGSSTNRASLLNGKNTSGKYERGVNAVHDLNETQRRILEQL